MGDHIRIPSAEDLFFFLFLFFFTSGGVNENFYGKDNIVFHQKSSSNKSFFREVAKIFFALEEKQPTNKQPQTNNFFKFVLYVF